MLDMVKLPSFPNQFQKIFKRHRHTPTLSEHQIVAFREFTLANLQLTGHGQTQKIRYIHQCFKIMRYTSRDQNCHASLAYTKVCCKMKRMFHHGSTGPPPVPRGAERGGAGGTMTPEPMDCRGPHEGAHGLQEGRWLQCWAYELSAGPMSSREGPSKKHLEISM